MSSSIAQKAGIKNPLLQGVTETDLQIFKQCTERNCAENFGQCVGLRCAGNCAKKLPLEPKTPNYPCANLDGKKPHCFPWGYEACKLTGNICFCKAYNTDPRECISFKGTSVTK